MTLLRITFFEVIVGIEIEEEKELCIYFDVGKNVVLVRPELECMNLNI